ncbi:thioredoxin-like protein [Scleroderma citrinum]
MAEDNVMEITKLEEYKQIINGDILAIIDFTATWCGPCRLISPIFKRFSSHFTGVNFYKVDVDDAEDISQEAGIRMMPTFIVYKNGGKMYELMGSDPKALEDLIIKVGGQLPIKKAEEPQPITKDEEPQSITEDEEQQPITKDDEQQPIAEMEGQQFLTEIGGRETS